MIGTKMLTTILIGAMALTGAATADVDTTSWTVHGIEKGKPSADLDTKVIVASAHSNEGQGLVLLCSEDSGLYTIFTYEPEEDLFAQSLKSQNFLRNKSGSITIDGVTSEDVWIWKRRHSTLQAKKSNTGIKLLNAVFSQKPVTMNFDGMEPMTVTFPEAGDELMSFISNCDATNPKKSDSE